MTMSLDSWKDICISSFDHIEKDVRELIKTVAENIFEDYSAVHLAHDIVYVSLTT